MRRKKNWPLEKQGTFLLRLGKLLNKGYSLAQAIEFLGIQQSSAQRQDLQQCLLQLRSGIPLHEALQKLDFPAETIGYLFFAEQHGNLAQGLCEAGNMLLLKARYINRLKRLSSYPLFLIFFMIMMLMLVQQVLFPQFAHLSSSFYAEDSFLSSSFIHAFLLLPDVFLSFLLFVVFLIILYFIGFKRLHPAVQMNLYLAIPFVRRLVVLYHSQFFAFQFSHLLNGGLSVYEALQVFEKQTNLPMLQLEADRMKKQLAKGEKLDWIIQSRKYYEKELALVIRHGQSNGELAKELLHYSQFVLQRIEETLERWLRVIQPLFFSIIGLLVVLMYLAILLPMFQVINHL
ncbi:competence-related pilin export protein ComGB [Anoxybacillus vitaminiphilus]|uniref:Competence-related pilin export protein ComGB n=1 Tax=Paranoxybacillus vitaminiphilus TaxID=581036 RepID=A0A327YN53_9BACL|nr:competence type IV pilus assembly protein ComGB [Anoxybacillus vitaminiphilus]RAK22373.1 competence-related pilin export protein ComGB [Anoxybacillus vitaminiphilus]